MERHSHGWIRIVGVLLSVLPNAVPQACPPDPGGEVGLPTNLPNSNAWGNVQETMVMTGAGEINCEGIVTAWTFSKGRDCAGSPELEFHIFRGAGPYQLIGTNTYTCNTAGTVQVSVGSFFRVAFDFVGSDSSESTSFISDVVNAILYRFLTDAKTIAILVKSNMAAKPVMGETILNIPPRERIPVLAGDLIGWSSNVAVVISNIGTPAGSPTVVYSDGAGACLGFAPGTFCSLLIPSVHDFYVKAHVIKAPPPTISNLPAVVSVWENDPVVNPLYTVVASNELNAVLASDIIANSPVTLTFTISPAMTEFSLVPAPPALPAGQPCDVQTTAPLDYEVSPQYLVGISVQSLGVTTTQILTVNVLDRNEPHSITPLPASVDIWAPTTMADEQIYQVTITDPDATNDVKFYIATIDSLGAPFYMEPNTGILRASQDLLNWISPATFVIDIKAADNMHEVTAPLTVNVLSTRQPPALLNVPTPPPPMPPVTATVPEDAPAGSIIFQATASGPEPGQIRFSIRDVTYTQRYNSFSMDPVTGEISLSANPDLDYFLRTTPFNIKIGVRDDLQVGADGDLTVVLGHVNQHPYFDPSEYSASFDEECAPPACMIPALIVNALDRDTSAPISDGLTCTVMPPFAAMFRFPGLVCGSMEVLQRIDLDAEPQYSQMNVTILVDDSSGGSSTGVVRLSVNYINDNLPVFAPNTYTASINENVAGGVSVLTVIATDADLGVDGDIVFSLQSLPDGLGTQYFQIHPTTGVVSTRQAADYELPLTTTIAFKVLATDKGSPSQTDVASVTINVIDVNDIAPFWNCGDRWTSYEPYDLTQPCFYNTEVRGEILIGYEAVQIQAVDNDTVTPSPTYFLLTPNNHFLLQTLDGKVLVKRELQDYKEYILYTYAQDNGNPDLWSEMLHVRVDTYNPSNQLVDITLEIPMSSFNQSAIQRNFIVALQTILVPWLPKMERVRLDKDKTVVTVYALEDTITYDLDNLDKPKKFVHRDSLLSILRTGIKGIPSDDLLGPVFNPYGPILVMPTYPFWLLDTIPGLITLSVVCLVAALLILLLVLLLCNKYQVLCFKKKPPPRVWESMEVQEYSVVKDDAPGVRQRQKVQRRPSVDTVHSQIFAPDDRF